MRRLQKIESKDPGLDCFSVYRSFYEFVLEKPRPYAQQPQLPAIGREQYIAVQMNYVEFGGVNNIAG